MSSNPFPDVKTPLVTTPSPPTVGGPIIDGLGQLARLVGTWNSTDSNYSWNVMPLPQDTDQDGFILKNFAYNEEVTFATIPGNAPNRGGGFTQVANTLFYEQRVYFAPTSAPFKVPDGSVNTLVHAENGSWLFLDVRNQFAGAFPVDGSPAVPLPFGQPLPVQDVNSTIAKQMSVPHGNSILATGWVNPPAVYPAPPSPVVSPENPGTPTLSTKTGSPNIPELNAIPIYNGQPYGAAKYQPSTKNKNGVESNSNINPNIKLLDYIAANPVNDYVHISVSAPENEITNIPFETGHAKVNGYSMELWIVNPGTKSEAILYYQNIGMAMTLSSDKAAGTKTINFPHITCNVIHKA